MLILIIILVVLLIPLGWWLSTLRYVKTPPGQTKMIAWFDEPMLIVGNTLPNIEITPDIIDLPADELKEIQPKIDRKGAIVWKIFPMEENVFFDYRYKHFKTIKEILATKGEIKWQPTIPLGEDGKPIYKENSTDTIALGEWKEIGKQTLFIRERESIVIKFTSKDPIRGVKKAYIRFIVWNMALATKSLYNSKEDAEKKITDMFQEWARTKGYFEDIQGIGFASIDHNNVTGKQFIKDLNKEIYKSGVVVEGVDLFEDFIEPGSQDVYDAKEKEIKGKLLLKAAKIDTSIAKAQGQAAKEKQLEINKGEANRLKITNDAEVIKDKKLKQNEVDQNKKNLQNEKTIRVSEFREKTKIAVNGNGKVIDKVIKAKKTPDASTVKKWSSIEKSKITTFVDNSGRDSTDNLDEDLTGHVTANLITLPKPEGGKS